MSDLYFSVDVESDGPIPGPNSMLNFGCAVFSEDTGERVLDTFGVNLELLEGATPNRETMEWWKRQPEAWKRVREKPMAPVLAMSEFVAWVKQMEAKHGGRAVCVCYPVGYDWTFLYWYMMRFVGHSPFGFSAVVDVKTVAWQILMHRGNAFFKGMREVTKKNFPKEWLLPRERHTHVGVDDATEQGIMFMRMLAHKKQ